MQNPDFVLPWAVSKIVYRPPGGKKHSSHTDEAHCERQLSEAWRCGYTGSYGEHGLPLTAALTSSLDGPVFF